MPGDDSLDDERSAIYRPDWLLEVVRSKVTFLSVRPFGVLSGGGLVAVSTKLTTAFALRTTVARLRCSTRPPLRESAIEGGLTDDGLAGPPVR